MRCSVGELAPSINLTSKVLEFFFKAVFAVEALKIQEDILVHNDPGFFTKAMTQKTAGNADTNCTHKGTNGAAHNHP